MDFIRKMGGSSPAVGGAKPADGMDVPAPVPSSEIIKSGILRKQGGGVKTWKERYFTLTKDALSYYKAKDDKDPIDSIPVAKIRVCQREETDTRNPSRFPHYFSVDTGNRVYVIGSRDEPERNAWVDAINSLIKDMPKDLPPLPASTDPLRASVENIAAAVEATKIATAPAPSTPAAAAPIVFAAAQPAPVVVVPKPRTVLTGTVLQHTMDAQEFATALKSIVRSENVSDVVLAPGNFAAHRAILSARAPAIAQLIDNKQVRPIVTIPNVSADTLARLLDYIYTDQVVLNGDNAIELFSAASGLGLTRLQQLATVFVRDNVTTDNVLPMLQSANRLKATELEKFLFKFFQTPERYNEVIRQPEISEIAMDNKALYVAISQVLAQSADKYATDFSSVAVGPSTLAQDLTNLFISGNYADVRIIGKDGDVLAHKVILAARCPAILEQGLQVADEESRLGRVLKFPTLEAEVIQELVQSLYSNVLCIDNPDTSFGLMELADRVRQETIVDICSNMFKKNLNKETAIRTLMVASQYELVALKKEALNLIIKEAPSILTRQNLKPMFAKWPWSSVDIIRALVRGNANELTDDEGEGDNGNDSDDD